MSNSRKQPYYTDYSRSSTREIKRFASKKVRSYPGEIPNGKAYRKLYCSWNIRDYVCHCPEDPKAYRK